MTQTRSSARSSRAGFSLLEILISLTMLVTFTGSLLLVLFTGTKTAHTGMARQGVESLARRTMDRIAAELVSSGTSVLVPNPTGAFGSATLTFQCVEGLGANNNAAWGTPRKLALQLEEGENDDGVDNNGNGLVDERALVWTIDPGGAGEQSTIWAHGVREYLEGESPNGLDDNGNGLLDERGLSFVRQAGLLTIRLSLEQVDTERNHLVRTVQTTLRLRN